jgi:hypothetical protein
MHQRPGEEAHRPKSRRRTERLQRRTVNATGSPHLVADLAVLNRDTI